MSSALGRHTYKSGTPRIHIVYQVSACMCLALIFRQHKRLSQQQWRYGSQYISHSPVAEAAAAAVAVSLLPPLSRLFSYAFPYDVVLVNILQAMRALAGHGITGQIVYLDKVRDFAAFSYRMIQDQRKDK